MLPRRKQIHLLEHSFSQNFAGKLRVLRLTCRSTEFVLESLIWKIFQNNNNFIKKLVSQYRKFLKQFKNHQNFNLSTLKKLFEKKNTIYTFCEKNIDIQHPKRETKNIKKTLKY